MNLPKTIISVFAASVLFGTQVHLALSQEDSGETSQSAETEEAGETEKLFDWRKDGDSKEQLEQLIHLVPGVAHWMPVVAYRYQSIYWAAKQEKWEFAHYQFKSLQNVLKLVSKARVKRAAQLEEFRLAGMRPLSDHLKNKDWGQFEKAFSNLADACNACHVETGFEFITVPSVPPKPNNIVLGYPAE